MIPIANYGLLGLVDLGFYVLLPLFYSSPIRIGGLGLSPPIIGTIRATFGFVDGCVQALFAAKMIRWFGAKNVFFWAVLWIYPLILFFPIMSAVVTMHGKVGPLIWFLLVAQLMCMVLMDLAFSACVWSKMDDRSHRRVAVIFVFVTRAAPNKESLGSVHGISQSFASIARAIGPVLTTSSFAASKQYNILGGNFAYVVLAILTTILVMLSLCLPDLKDDE